MEPSENTYDLLGRPFVYGIYDCFTIVKDYFETQDINIYPYEYEWEFWEKQEGETPLGGEMGVSFVSDRTNTFKDSSDN